LVPFLSVLLNLVGPHGYDDSNSRFVKNSIITKLEIPSLSFVLGHF